MKPCFGYIRVSTQKQGEGVSLEAQKDAIMAFASRSDLSITEWFEEKETAAKSGRPIFTKMLKLLENGEATGVVIHKIDRSARNLKDWAIISDLSDAGIGVYFATESLDFRSRGGRLTADIQAVIAADYIRNLSEEARKGIHGRLKQGLFPWPAPPGYQNHGGGKPKTIDPIKGPLIRQLFDLYLTGDHSISSLHNTMKKRGLTSARGSLLSRHTIEHILANPFYCGFVRNGRTGEMFNGVHQPMITVREFDRVQLIKSGRYTKKTTRHQHLLRRLIACVRCGTVLTGELHNNRCYYRCHTKGCISGTLREDVADQVIKDTFASLSLSAQTTNDVKNTVLAWDFTAHYRAKLAHLDLRIAEIKTRSHRLTDLLIDGAIDTATHHERKAGLELDLAKLTEERQQETKNLDNEGDRQIFFEKLKTLSLLYEIADDDEKRRLLEMATSKMNWDGKNLYIEPRNLGDALKFG